MSGMEIAGVVLAVLPLFISAWENYQAGLEPAKAFFQWERQLPEYIRSLRDAATLYEMNIEALIAPVASDQELELMMDKSFDDLWKDPDLQKRILDRLGKASSAFQSNMQQFESICSDIADCLELSNQAGNTIVARNNLDLLLNNRAKSSSNNPKFELRRRTKFGWSKKRIKRLLAQVQQCNSTLRQLTDMVRYIEPYRTRRKPPPSHHLHHIQNHANKLSKVFSRAWSCALHSSHMVGIQLERRMSAAAEERRVQVNKGEPCANCVLFSVAFSMTENQASQTQGKFRELEIAVTESGVEKSIVSPTTQQSANRPNVRVTFESADKSDPIIDAERLQMVKNICLTICRDNAPTRLGFYLGDSHEDFHGTYPALRNEGPCFSGDAELVYLEQLLPLRRKRTSGFTTKQRVLLASTLASSLLQLYSTAWLARGWSKQRVLFLRHCQRQEAVDVERPLLLHNFSQQASQSSRVESKLAMLSLGILLLELYYGETIESYFSEDELQLAGLETGMRHLALASKWLSEESENLRPAQRCAVSFCLESFVGIKTDLNDSTFRTAVHEKVVAPLQDEAKDFLDHRMKT